VHLPHRLRPRAWQKVLTVQASCSARRTSSRWGCRPGRRPGRQAVGRRRPDRLVPAPFRRRLPRGCGDRLRPGFVEHSGWGPHGTGKPGGGRYELRTSGLRSTLSRPLSNPRNARWASGRRPLGEKVGLKTLSSNPISFPWHPKWPVGSPAPGVLGVPAASQGVDIRRVARASRVEIAPFTGPPRYRRCPTPELIL